MAEHIWHVNVVFTQEGDRTRADAILELDDARFQGLGQAKRAPGDPPVPLIGRDLAAARALSGLAHRLLDTAAGRIESFEGHPVSLRE